MRDPLRVSYLQQHIGAVHDAIQAGCDVRGARWYSRVIASNGGMLDEALP